MDRSKREEAFFERGNLSDFEKLLFAQKQIKDLKVERGKDAAYIEELKARIEITERNRDRLAKELAGETKGLATVKSQYSKLKEVNNSLVLELAELKNKTN